MIKDLDKCTIKTILEILRDGCLGYIILSEEDIKACTDEIEKRISN